MTSIIESFSPKDITKRKRYDSLEQELFLSWEAFFNDPQPNTQKALITAFTFVSKYQGKHFLSAQQKRIIRRVYHAWENTGNSIFCDTLLRIFPKSDTYATIYLGHFYRRYTHKDSKHAREVLWQKCVNKAKVRNALIKKAVTMPGRRFMALCHKVGEKTGRGVRKVVRYRMCKRGYSDYMADEWMNMVLTDLKNNKTDPLRKKIWCYRRGYMPWRIEQYGLTKDNYKTFLSDRDYCYLHPINNSFVKWINDKITPRYILDSFKDFIPKCYYHIIRRNGASIPVKLIDCPEDYEATFEDILRLLREKGDLAVKPSSGTHGVGFRKLSYRNGVYYINNRFSSIWEITNYFRSMKNFYLVSEYVTMHPQLREIYPESVNTIRVMVINEDGNSPCITDAYMRIGSSRTGVTDNVGFGGVFAKIDVKQGIYYCGEQTFNHVIKDCPNHPDTGVLIEGYLPNWDTVTKGIQDICLAMPQLEYMGFDIAITEEGFMVLEVNVHQDLHRYPLYQDYIKDFFFRKLENKKRWNHIK